MISLINGYHSAMSIYYHVLKYCQGGLPSKLKKTSPGGIRTKDPDRESRTYTRSRLLGYGPLVYDEE